MIKKVVALLVLLLPLRHVCAQEFKEYPNGLIYSDSAVSKLKYIVDSLNLRFKYCDLTRVFNAMPQAKGHYIMIERNLASAERDIKANLPFEEIVKKYGDSIIQRDLLVIRYNGKDYKGNDEIAFSCIDPSGQYNIELSFQDDLDYYTKQLKGKWVYESGGNRTQEYIRAFYFPEEFSTPTIPPIYAQLVQYSDCLIDTSTSVFYENATGGWRGRREKTPNIDSFLSFVSRCAGRNSASVSYLYSQYADDSGQRLSYCVDSLRKAGSAFDIRLRAAIDEAEKYGGNSEVFEDFIGKYYSKVMALELKRHRIVVGSCSQDRGPRKHALSIAKLAAETANWDVFLRAHLDIMNDRFERAIDASYGKASRNTYIKELEVLNINIQDLLIGISLQLSNPSKNHYVGSISRLGRALAETSRPDEIETKLLGMIGDNALDDMNRIMMCYLFINYNYSLTNKERQVKNQEKIKVAVKNLPPYLAARVNIEN